MAAWPPLSWSQVATRTTTSNLLRWPFYNLFIFISKKSTSKPEKISMYFLKINMFSACFLKTLNIKKFTKQFSFVDPTNNYFQMCTPSKTFLNFPSHQKLFLNQNTKNAFQNTYQTYNKELSPSMVLIVVIKLIVDVNWGFHGFVNLQRKVKNT